MKRLFTLLLISFAALSCEMIDEKLDDFLGRDDSSVTTIPNNQIWYTSTDGKIVEPYSGEYNEYADAITTFGANIVSNTYVDGKGVIEFDGDVTIIGDYAFLFYNTITTLSFPKSVTTIGNCAFYNCSSLTSVTIPDSVTTIGDGAFHRCSSLTSVTIGDSVTTIGRSAFRSCSSLISVTIGDSVTTIGSYAFYGCSSLTSVTIPDSVTEIGSSAFENCTSLTIVYCKATTPPVALISDGYYWSAFYDNASDRKIYVPMDSVEAYKNAAGWKNYANDIVVYDFEQNTNESNSCTITGSHASFTMSDSGSLYSLAKKVIDNVNTTEEWGNEIWSNIISITINGMMDARDFSTLKWNFRNLEILDISNVVVTGYTGDKGTVEGYEYYYDDNTIPLGAFFYWMSHILRPFPQELSDEGMSSLVQIKLPDGIKTIQRNAFARAYNLIDINIPDSVETIGWVSFSICTSLEHITIPENVLEIEDWAFKGCSSLNSVYCKAIYPPICGSRVFDDNASNRKIYVPNESVEAYKSTSGWSEYKSAIVGYNF